MQSTVFVLYARGRYRAVTTAPAVDHAGNTVPVITFCLPGCHKDPSDYGEPTVRRDIVPLMQGIGQLRQDGLSELCLTTSGVSLHRKLDQMVEAGLTVLFLPRLQVLR